MRKSHVLLCAFVSGVLLCCAFPPVGLGLLAYVAIIPLLYILDSLKPGKVFLWSFFSGIVFLGLSLFWIANHEDVIWLVVIPVVIILGFFYALPFVISGYIRTFYPRAGLIIFPFSVAGIEWIRSFDQLAFPWMIIGNSQTGYPWLIQFADITSAYGVSCWVTMVNVSIYFLIKKRSIFRWISLVLLFVVPIFYSYFVMHSSNDTGEEITVALIQGNVSPEEKWADGREEWNINLYRSMSVKSLIFNPDIIIWPESATPVYLIDVQVYRRMVQSLVDSIGIPVFTGMPSVDFDTGRTWNSAGLFLPGENEVKRYNKIHLVPFGEAIPMDDVFPILKTIDFGQANWSEGNKFVVFTPEGLPPFNTVICFESIFPDLVRKFIVKGSQYLVVITNDVWFGPFASPIQHAMISVMRAIEFHRPVVRCANTGISMFIDQYGRIISRTGTFERTILAASISPNCKKTVYCRFGNIFSIASLAVTLISLFFCCIFRNHFPASILRSKK